MFDFGDGHGPVPAHRHSRGGGWVADTAQVEPTVWVAPGARVYGHAVLSGYATVSDHAVVKDHAVVRDRAALARSAVAGGSAVLSGYALLYDDAKALGSVVLSGVACLGGSLEVSTHVVPVVDRGLAARAAAQIEDHPESYDQGDWHSECDTVHCAAGWIVKLAGDHGRELEMRMGTGYAAAALLGEAYSDCPFHSDDDPLPWLKKIGMQG